MEENVLFVLRRGRTCPRSRVSSGRMSISKAASGSVPRGTVGPPLPRPNGRKGDHRHPRPSFVLDANFQNRSVQGNAEGHVGNSQEGKGEQTHRDTNTGIRGQGLSDVCASYVFKSGE